MYNKKIDKQIKYSISYYLEDGIVVSIFWKDKGIVLVLRDR